MWARSGVDGVNWKNTEKFGITINNKRYATGEIYSVIGFRDDVGSAR